MNAPNKNNTVTLTARQREILDRKVRNSEGRMVLRVRPEWSELLRLFVEVGILYGMQRGRSRQVFALRANCSPERVCRLTG